MKIAFTILLLFISTPYLYASCQGQDAMPDTLDRAFVVSVSDYKHLPKLDVSKNDMYGTADRLYEFGYDTTLCANLTARELRARMDSFARWQGTTDVLVIHVSMHGAVIAGKTYLCMVDVLPEDLYFKPNAHFVAVQELVDMAIKIHAKYTLILVDACREEVGVAVGNSTITRHSSPERFKLPPNMILQFAAGFNRQAFFAWGRNSCYSTGFLKFLDELDMPAREVLMNAGKYAKAHGRGRVTIETFGSLPDSASFVHARHRRRQATLRPMDVK